ncbi:hypothetical protein D3C81_421990 [compost metagenome]
MLSTKNRINWNDGLWWEVPSQYCQYYYLKDIAKPIVESDRKLKETCFLTDLLSSSIASLYKTHDTAS